MGMSARNHPAVHPPMGISGQEDIRCHIYYIVTFMTPVETIERLTIPFRLIFILRRFALLFSFSRSSFLPYGALPSAQSPRHHQRTPTWPPMPTHTVERRRREGQIVSSCVLRLLGIPGFPARWPTPAIFLITVRQHPVCAARTQKLRRRPRQFASWAPLCGEVNRTLPSTHPSRDPSA